MQRFNEPADGWRRPSASVVPESDPLRRSITERTDILIGIVIAAVFALIHGTTSLFWVFPGDSARFIASFLDIEPIPAPKHQFFIWVFRLVSGICGVSNATVAFSVATLAVSSLCVFMVYIVSVAVFRMMTDLPHLRDNVVRGEKWLWLSPRAAALAAASALGFSAPFWTASTRVNPDSFYLLGLLFVAYMLVRFIATDDIRPLFGAAAIYGALCTQSSTALQFLPILATLVVFGSLRGERPVALTLLGPIAVAAFTAAAASLICVRAFMAGENYRLLHYSGPGQVFGMIVFGTVSEAFAGLGKPHWLVIGSTTILPFIAWLAAGKWALDGTKYIPLRVLDFAIFLSSILVLSGSRYSPWGLFGIRPEQIVASMMASMSFAYCLLAWHQQALFLFSRTGAPPFPGARVFGFFVRFLVVAIGAACLFWEAGVGKNAADSRPARFLKTYVDALISGLGERDLLVTDPMLEDVVRIRAKERGRAISVINLAASPASAGRRRLRKKIKDPILGNAFDLGIFPFLQEYIGHDPEAGKRVAMTFFPDIWNIGPYRAYPHGLCFVGVPDSAPLDNPLETAPVPCVETDAAAWRRTSKLLQPQLEAVPETSPPSMLASARIVRQRVSFIGNNLAFWMFIADKTADAMQLWHEVHAFDPDNLSAMLNLFTAFDREGLEKERETVREELETFRRKMTKPLQIWELSRSQGYVVSPDAFASLGLSWAITGQTALALGTLDSALRDGIGDGSAAAASPILLAMGAIHGKMGDAEAAERAFMQVLEKDPNNSSALIGLVRARLSQGELDDLDGLVERLSALGVQPERLVHIQANYLVQRGRNDEAVAFVHKALGSSPKDPDLLLDLFTASTAQLAASTNSATRIDARKRMEDVVQRLRSDPDARTFQGAIASAALHMVDREYAEAREEFRIANKTAPGVPAILHQILRLDYGLQDKPHAEEHAREILSLVPRHGFANYIMGSLALGAGRLDSAKAFLERSAQNWNSALPRGDLAYALYRLRENEKAELSARDALVRSDKLYEVWDTLGLVMLAAGRPEEAREAFGEALSRRSSARVVHLHLARAELMLGNKDAARGILDDLQNDESKFQNEDRQFFNELWKDLHGAPSPGAAASLR